MTLPTIESTGRPNWPELDAAYAEAERRVDETQAACDAILGRSNLWLTVHPIRNRRLRRDMLRKRDLMHEARDRYMAIANAHMRALGV